MRKMRFLFCVVFLVVLYAGSAFAQADRATVTGTVTDPGGAVLAGVSIVITKTDTGAKFTSVTDNSGVYNVSGLPLGPYTVHMSHPGFKETQTSVDLLAAQVQSLDVHMPLGSTSQTVTVSAAPPLLETETSSVGMTMEAEAIKDLPLNATGGRDAMNLMINTVPTMAGSTMNIGGTTNFLYFAGGLAVASTVYIDGVEGTAGNQGDVPTPGADALQEMQVQTGDQNAELGATGSGVILFELKSGTNQIHGSAFEFLQNEALNANTWSDKFFLAQCSPSDASCISQYKRPRDRFNDYGGSAGGPIWKNHTFIFGDYEHYNVTNDTLIPNSQTVPDANMLIGNFSELLTGGANTGDITNPATEQPYINPCTGLVYQYGQIFDPLTQTVVGGQTCATPFPGNVIPPGRVSAEAKLVAQIYTKYEPPTIDRIYDNFPSMASNNPSLYKNTVDLKLDHNFSTSHHISASYDYVKWLGLYQNGGTWYILNSSPFSSAYRSLATSHMIRFIDNYAFNPRLLNTFAAGFSYQPSTQTPQTLGNFSDYGFNADSAAFPVLIFAPSNGVGVTQDSSAVDAYFNYYGYHYQDSLAWQNGRHSFKFGGYLLFQGMDSSFGGNQENYNFANETGGPTDPVLVGSGGAHGTGGLVGNGFASMMLGNVQSASENVPYPAYPRQKYLTLFGQDAIKVNSRLTVNLGLDWDFTFAGHEQNGHWTNFDLQAQNPLWGNYPGAWTFASNSGSTFESSNTLRQFGPHAGLAYKLTNKLVVRAGYGLYYIPLGALTSGYGPWFPANQAEFWTGTNVVSNSVPGSIAFNWDQGYPGQTLLLPRSITQTSMGAYDYVMYISPQTLHLGYTQDLYYGFQYEMAKNLSWDVRYMGTRGNDLHDDPESIWRNYPNFSTYSALLTSGHINDTISNTAQAAAANVPYPYAGFSGPAYAAIAPIPQTASYNNTTVLTTGEQLGVSDYNAVIIEMKARNSHGLNGDLSYTVSHLTGSNLVRDNFGNQWGYGYQSADDIPASHKWIQSMDQRSLAEGYVTYYLPLGRGQKWLSGSSRLVNYAVSGWTVGAFGSYGSGFPMGTVSSAIQYPFFYGNQRANFANGTTAYNIKNHFGKHLDLANLTDASNQDFNPNLFSTPTLGTLGNSPYYYNNWRWNPGAAQENGSLMKAFSFGPDGRFRATIRAEAFNVFNRHYFAAPNTSSSSPYFGQVTSLDASLPENRTGQLAARFQW
jgi:hypothetical protein